MLIMGHEYCSEITFEDFIDGHVSFEERTPRNRPYRNLLIVDVQTECDVGCIAMIFGIRPMSRMAVPVPASDWGFLACILYCRIFSVHNVKSARNKNYYEVGNCIKHNGNDEKKQILKLHQKAPSKPQIASKHSPYYFASYMHHPWMQLPLLSVTHSPLGSQTQLQL